ncbi:multiple organellar RNA editing factor 8, chloroplastic/mitochondrial-like isoform X2 [Primulina huaijiensis]|uniref:multiple organellar RNA editing factor 8, chloroplastic/mitochondrial-like isoform X2 n=1 Tax=Primulina huaijiensis TaxID=1492673 RepID=UPI003CC712FF
MATRYLTRSLHAITKQNPFSTHSRSHTTAPSAVFPNSSPFLFRIRPLVATDFSSNSRSLAPALSTRAFASRQTASSLNDPNPNWSKCPPKETILLDGCDFEHWLVVMEKPENEPTRDEIIDSYIKTLAVVVGSEEEARMKIYSVSTRHYFAFGALVSEELSYKLKELPKVRWVLPDSYLDVRKKDYGGEPFINGQAVPYDPKYHEEWVRNNARANERNRRNDRPRNFDRSRNFERRRDVQMNNQNHGANPNVPNTGAMQPNMHQQHNNMGGQSRYGGNMSSSNSGNYPPNAGDVPNNASNQHGNAPNSRGMPYQSGPGPSQNSFGPNSVPGPIPNPNSYASNMGLPSPGQMGPPILDNIRTLVQVQDKILS